MLKGHSIILDDNGRFVAIIDREMNEIDLSGLGIVIERCHDKKMHGGNDDEDSDEEIDSEFVSMLKKNVIGQDNDTNSVVFDEEDNQEYDDEEFDDEEDNMVGCSACGSTAIETTKCTCGHAQYCSEECQQSHWDGEQSISGDIHSKTHFIGPLMRGPRARTTRPRSAAPRRYGYRRPYAVNRTRGARHWRTRRRLNRALWYATAAATLPWTYAWYSRWYPHDRYAYVGPSVVGYNNFYQPIPMRIPGERREEYLYRVNAELERLRRQYSAPSGYVLVPNMHSMLYEWIRVY